MRTSSSSSYVSTLTSNDAQDYLRMLLMGCVFKYDDLCMHYWSASERASYFLARNKGTAENDAAFNVEFARAVRAAAYECKPFPHRDEGFLRMLSDRSKK